MDNEFWIAASLLGLGVVWYLLASTLVEFLQGDVNLDINRPTCAESKRHDWTRQQEGDELQCLHCKKKVTEL